MASENSDLVEFFTSTTGRSPTKDELIEFHKFMENLRITEEDENAVAEEFVGVPRELTLMKRNACWILSNQFEDGGEQIPLIWYKIDERKIDETFSWLNFEIQKTRDLSTNGIKGWIKGICKEDYGDQECLVLFILSHGTDKREILGSDSKPLNIEEEIVDKLTGIKSLQGKPKLIFIQACRGTEAMKVVDAANDDIHRAGGDVDQETELKAQKADTFVYYSTTQGNLAWLGSNQGSFFINKLCTVLQQYCGNYHFGDIVTKVNDILSRHIHVNKSDNKSMVQVSEACSTLTCNIRFRPIGEFCEFKKNFQYKEI